jgi:hypothetical protein
MDKNKNIGNYLKPLYSNFSFDIKRGKPLLRENQKASKLKQKVNYVRKICTRSSKPISSNFHVCSRSIARTIKISRLIIFYLLLNKTK